MLRLKFDPKLDFQHKVFLSHVSLIVFLQRLVFNKEGSRKVLPVSVAVY